MPKQIRWHRMSILYVKKAKMSEDYDIFIISG